MKTRITVLIAVLCMYVLIMASITVADVSAMESELVITESTVTMDDDSETIMLQEEVNETPDVDKEQSSPNGEMSKKGAKGSSYVNIYFDKTNITVRKDGYYSNTWHYTSGSSISFSSSNPNIVSISNDGRSYTLRNPGTATIKAVATKGGSSATASYNVNVTAVPFNGYKSLSFKKVRFSFSNFGSKASLKLCKVMYKSSHAKRFYSSAANNGAYGNCFGMATCSGLFYANGITPSKLKKTDQYIWTTSGKKTTISVEDQIKAMHITCAADQNSDSWYVRNTDELMNAVKTDLGINKITVVTVQNNKLGAHAISVIGFKADDRSKDHLIIYDSYYGVNAAKSLYLYKNSDGTYNGKWKYPAASGKTFDSTEANTYLQYTTYSQYNNLWAKRGQLTFTEWCQ